MEKLNFTAKQAALAGNVSIPTLRKWMRTPGFPVMRAGKKILIPVDAYRRWLEKQAGGDRY